MSYIEFDHVSFTYSTSTKALEDVSFSIEQGKCVLFMGLSGYGKTTLLRLINGLIPSCFKGKLEGHIKVGSCNEKSKIEDYIGLTGSVFQNPKTQFFNTNTTSELAFPCENTGMETYKIKERIDKISKEYHIEHLLNRSIFEISGGQKQLVSFSAANMLSPSILVLDEPTSNLDDFTIQRLREYLILAKKAGKTIIIGEHRLAWLNGIIDDYYLLDHGKMINHFTYHELQQIDLYSLGLRTIDLETVQTILRNKQYYDSASTLMIDHLVIGYKHQAITTIRDFHLLPGKILCIMGSNGTGKTTLIKTLCGLLKPIEGKISYQGKEISKRELLKKSFLVMQDVNYQLFSDSVEEEILLGTKLKNVDNLLKSLDLYDLKDRHPMSLSGGQKQRVAIACALASNKEIMIFDEPTSGLDYLHMVLFGNQLLELKKQSKMIIIVTHDEELAAKYADYIYHMEVKEC